MWGKAKVRKYKVIGKCHRTRKRWAELPEAESLDESTQRSKTQ